MTPDQLTRAMNPKAFGDYERVLVFQITSDPSQRRVAVTIDAIDSNGGRAVNLETGLPYPSDYTRVTPYTHSIIYTPGVILTVAVTVIMGGEYNDLLRCEIFDRGVYIRNPAPIPVSIIGEGSRSAKVGCTYTTGSVMAMAKPRPDPSVVDPLIQALIARRIELGWSQAELARRTDTWSQWVCRVESGRINLSIITLRRLTAALGCELTIARTPDA
jgi:DNA-binding XRE family transcriptional regulator